MLKRLDEMLDSFVEMGIPSIDIIVFRHGREIYRRMEGYSDAAKTRTLNGHERYNIYSCSKPITVTTAMQLWEEGKFGLDDKLSDYLPEFATVKVRENGELREPKREIRICDLFSMTAGFTYDLWSENLRLARSETNGRCQTREVMKYLAKDALIFDPGEQYNYSLCHDVIAALVEVVAQERFGEVVKKRIFEPLGMEDSTYLPTEDEIASLAEQYSFDSNERVYKPIGGHNGFRIGSEYESGGAGCVTTVEDYMKFLEGWRTDKLLRPETLALMATNRLNELQLRQYGMEGRGYGLGLRCEYAGSGKTDFGWGGAAGAYLACDKVHDFTVFHAQHVLNSPNQTLRAGIADVIRSELD